MNDTEYLKSIGIAAYVEHKRWGTWLRLEKHQLENECWMRMEQRGLREKTPDKYMIRKCRQVLMDFIRGKTRYWAKDSKFYDASITQLNVSLEYAIMNSPNSVMISDSSPDEIDTNDLIELIHKRAGLTEFEQKIIKLRFTERLTLEEITVVLELKSRRGTHYRLSKALSKIRVCLRGQGVEIAHRKSESVGLR